ncbi:VOC family protein [Pedobacter metabolipauper]|uniref:Lactoylglutathione lyase n=1 Tax=Pedobacter metabolipauper TaxID=425513 RepID=A0A4R6SWR8_9SPHI|nr:VOC family protein [Pedobacter metabolipauper]TDQ08592.1 lactoylglutathione lyase [Pedobacter metabolipauper]
MKIVLMLAFTVLLTIPYQKVMAQTEKKQKSAVLNHIAVYVSNLAEATAYYKTVFDLEQIPEPFHDDRHTWFTLGPAGQLHLIQGAKKSTVHDKNEHLCFSVADIDSFIAKLNTKKIAFEDWAGTINKVNLRVDGIKQIYFKDPDGHWLEVNDDHK